MKVNERCFFLLFCFFRVAADALRILLARAQLDEVLKRLEEENAWDAIKEENTHISGVTLLARYPPRSEGAESGPRVLRKPPLTRMSLEFSCEIKL